MPRDNSGYKRNKPSIEPRNLSWIDKVTGRHTNSVLLLILIIITLVMGLCILNSVQESTLKEKVVTGLFGIIGTELGILATLLKK